MASLLDTDVVSQWSKPVPDAQVARWLATVLLEETYISVVTIQELRTGIERLPEGRKRSRLEVWLSGFVLVKYKARILPVTLEIADLCGRMQQITRNGRPVAVLVSADEWEQRTAPKRSLGDAFRASPAFGVGIDFKRVNLEAREVKF